MARIKYDPLITPLNKEHYGYTFQRNNYGYSMFPASKSGRKRYPLQWEKMHYMSKAIRQWRNMSTETKTAWATFATTFPQPTEKDPDTFLTGYQLFLKRNFYRFLHEGLNFDFLLDPELSELPVPGYSIFILEDGLCVDVTEEYIRNFGILPQVGQFIICRIIPMATNSGQFFAPFIATLEVQEVYIDGLVCSFNFPSIVENIVFSLYMSKPVWESSQYAGTKFRYMGCFKPTQFIQLTDTPESYEGQAGKVVSVKDDETGVEFTESEGCEFCLPDPATGSPGENVQVNPAGDGYELAEVGGGGISCDDLLDCSIIQSILEQLENLQEFISINEDTAIPSVKYGALYNWYVFGLSEKISSSDDWLIPSIEQWDALVTYLGTTDVGGMMKETGFTYWNSPNTGAIDSLGFHWRGSGARNPNNGIFENINSLGYCWSSTDLTENFGRVSGCISSNSGRVRLAWFKWSAASIRLTKAAPGIADGSKTFYVGNNGRVYPAICYNQFYYLIYPLIETLYRSGNAIPNIQDSTAWNLSRSGAWAAYDNDNSNL